MRRLTAFLLIILMLAASILPICAETIAYTGNTPTAEVVHEQGGSQNIGADKEEGSFNLEYGVKEEFIVTIPEKVVMILNQTVSADISVSDVHLPRAKDLVIKISGDHYNDIGENVTVGWKIQNTDNPSVYLKYKVSQSADENSATITNDTSIITYNVADNTTGGTSTKLYFKVIEEPTLGGQYLDNLIFSVYIDS